LYKIISTLTQSVIVLDFEVLELIDEDSVKLIKIKAVLKGNCLLYITELHTKNYQKYSYHCQNNDGNLIARWDNKPHWKNMDTYPYHMHENDQVLPSHRVTITDVLDQIEKKIVATKGLP
jgi:hypothetical protein